MITENVKAEELIHTIDVTTVEATGENPSYIVDKRLLDGLLSKVTGGTLDDLKQDLFSLIRKSSKKDVLFKELDEYIYLDKIINHDNLKVTTIKDDSHEEA